MKRILPAFFLLSGAVPIAAAENTEAIFRISEVEVHSEFIDSYAEAGKAVASASVEREPGVICIVPLCSKDDPTVFRIVEIYTDQNAYTAHLQTEHFRKYKRETLHMIKSLALPDFTPVNPEGLAAVFRKIPIADS